MENISDKDVENITLEKCKVKEDTIELIANQMYDKITMLINERREKYGGASEVEPIKNYDNFNLDDSGNLTFTYKSKVIKFGNINEHLYSPSKMIKELSVTRLKLMGFSDISRKEVEPSKYKDIREKVRKLNDNLNGRSKEIYIRCRGY